MMFAVDISTVGWFLNQNEQLGAGLPISNGLLFISGSEFTKTWERDMPNTMEMTNHGYHVPMF